MKTYIAILLLLLLPASTLAQVIFPNRGGTGTTTIPTTGQVLMAFPNGTYGPVSTSTLGITGGGGGGGGDVATSTIRAMFSATSPATYNSTTGVIGVTTTGNWIGTFDGQEGSYYLDRANHIGTQLAATISDFVATVRTAISETITGLTYNNSTGVLSLDAGYVIPLTASTTQWQSAFSWGNHATAGYIATTSGNWAGTFDGQEGTFYLSRANHTGSQAISTITGLQTALDGKASTSHTHTASQITDFDTEVSNNTDVAANTAARHSAVTLAGALDYITIAGQTITRNAIDLATDVTGILGAVNGGTGQSGVTTGDLLYGSGTNTWSRRSIGSTGDVLSVVGGLPTWVATSTLGLGGSGGGSVTSVALAVPTGLTVSGSPITSSGTLTIGLAGGYVIPLTASTTDWQTAYSWGNHATAGYLTSIATSTVRGMFSATSPLSFSTTTGILSISTAGDWTGTFDGQEGSFYLSRANHTGTQLASTISDFTATARGTISETVTGLDYTSGTGVFSLTSGYTIPLTASTTQWADFYATPSTRITAGTGLSWSGNTLNSHVPVTVSGALDYITLVGQDIVRGAIDLATDVTGTLSLARGGTGSSLTDPNADRILFWDDSAGVTTWLTLGTNLSITGTTLDATGGGGGGGLATTSPWTNGNLAYVTGAGSVGSVATTTLVAGTGITFTGGTPVIVGTSPITIESTGGGGGGGGALSTTTDQIGDGGVQAVSYVTGDVMFGGSASTSAEFQFDDDGAKFFISSTTNTNATATIESTNNAQAVRIGDDSGRGLEWLFTSATEAVLRAYGTITRLLVNLPTIFTNDVTVHGNINFRMPYRNYVEFFNDWMDETTNAGDGGVWSEDINGTNAACSQSAIGESNRPGMVQCTTGTTATGRAGLVSGLNNTALGNGTTTFETAVSIVTLSDSTNRYQLLVGFQDTNGANQTDAAYLLYDEGGVTTGSAASANWQCVTANNSTRTFTTSTTTVTASVYNVLRVTVNPDGTKAQFFVNDTLICTHTTNIPTGITRAAGHGLQAIKSVGTTARTFNIDYHYARHEFTVPR